MKRNLIAFLLLTLMLFSTCILCACGGGGDDTDEPTNKRELLFDGENYTIFGKTANNNFDVIYAGGETSTMAEVAVGLCNKMADAGFPKPRNSADTDKDESILEFLIGDTNRALSAEAKAIVEANADPDTNDMHWVWLYKDGQLALYANSLAAYNTALLELDEKYFKDGAYKVEKVEKAYGNCAMFYCQNGSTVFMKTPISDSVEQMIMGVNATKIDLWGENNPKYHITLKLNNPEDQLRDSTENTTVKGFAGFRDMVNINKLYCSAFSNAKVLNWGEELHFNTVYSFSIQEDFLNPDREPDHWVGLAKQENRIKLKGSCPIWTAPVVYYGGFLCFIPLFIGFSLALCEVFLSHHSDKLLHSFGLIIPIRPR